MYLGPLLYLLICLITIEGNFANEEHLQLFPSASDYHPLVGNWTIKLLGNQGIFIHEIKTKFVANSHVYVDLVYDLEPARQEETGSNLHYGFGSKLKFRTLKIKPHSESDRGLETFDAQSEKPNNLNRLSIYAQIGIGNVSEVFEIIDNQLKLTLNKTLSIPFNSDLYTFLPIVIKEEINFDGESNGKPGLRLYLKLYVREVSFTVKLIQLQYLETWYPRKLFKISQTDDDFDYACLPNIEFPDSIEFGHSHIGFGYEKDNLIYYSQSPYSNVNCRSPDSSSICLLPINFMENVNPDPCLTSIYNNETIEEIQANCKLNCRKIKYPNIPDYRHYTEAKVIEIRDTLYISNVFSPIKRECRNSSLNVLIRPPPAGALGMKLPCLCGLYYKNELLWSRIQTENPPFCTNNSSETFDVFQVLPSEFVTLDQKNMSKSELDSQIFLNFSGHIIGRDIVETLLEELKNSNDGSYWNDWFFNFIVSLTIILAIEFCRSRGIRQNILRQPVVAEFIPARRRRKG